MFKEAIEYITGNSYYCVVDPYVPKIPCILSEYGVFMPINPNTRYMFERIYGVYEIIKGETNVATN